MIRNRHQPGRVGAEETDWVVFWVFIEQVGLLGDSKGNLHAKQGACKSPLYLR